ncbi:hypothetical protein [Nocardioides zeae]|uniref:Uncharacterized protein n=1 Tax=Nocardioides zeae TaxID=1457234 RepID=A0A6P0HGT6_9ACTN|nr:hypothetical protein [Nocardioides zeae]NEN77902.1 hypothetical protein [Nocardioides zeae]
MTTLPIRRSALLAAAVLGIAGVGLAASAGIAGVTHQEPRPVSTAEAEAWAEDLLALPPAEVCDLAAVVRMCERTLADAPGEPTGDVATEVDLQDDGTAVVTFRGALATGERFHTEINVLRDEAGDVRGVVPVYW